MHWEYFITNSFLTNAQLDELGARGWELVAVERDHNNSLTAYLKRPIQPETGAKQ